MHDIRRQAFLCHSRQKVIRLAVVSKVPARLKGAPSGTPPHHGVKDERTWECRARVSGQTLKKQTKLTMKEK